LDSIQLTDENISGSGWKMSYRWFLNSSAFSMSEEVKLLSGFFIDVEGALYWGECFVVFQRLPSLVERLDK